MADLGRSGRRRDPFGGEPPSLIVHRCGKGLGRRAVSCRVRTPGPRRKDSPVPEGLHFGRKSARTLGGRPLGGHTPNHDSSAQAHRPQNATSRPLSPRRPGVTFGSWSRRGQARPPSRCLQVRKFTKASQSTGQAPCMRLGQGGVQRQRVEERSSGQREPIFGYQAVGNRSHRRKLRPWCSRRTSW